MLIDSRIPESINPFLASLELLGGEKAAQHLQVRRELGEVWLSSEGD